MNNFRPKTIKNTLSPSLLLTQISESDEAVSQDIKSVFKIKKAAEPAYVKTYLCDQDKIFALTKGTQRLLYRLFEYVVYNDNKIYLNAAIKRQIASGLNIRYESIDNALSKLCNSNFLFRLDTGLYMLNPYYFAKGDWKNVTELRKFVTPFKTGTNEISFKVDKKALLLCDS